MSTAEVLRELHIEPTIGVTDPSNRENLQPKFLQKSTWNLYKYSVLRKGLHKKITIDKLVIGDIVALRRGDIVPADMRLLTAKSVTVLEHTITGSAAPSHKHTFASKMLLPKTEQKNMLFAGSEVIGGIAVGVIVRTSQNNIPSVAAIRIPSLQKKGLLAQNLAVKKILPTVDCVVFDDLQQETEILQLVQKLYLEKAITTIFFVNSAVAEHIRKHLPENIIYTATDKMSFSGITVCVDISEVQKSKIILSLKQNNNVVMFIHRGNERRLQTKIAAIDFVVSSTASQSALLQADLIAPKISIPALASILHNNK